MTLSQETNDHDGAARGVVDVYHRLAESLPTISDGSVFDTGPHLIEVLAVMFQSVLEVQFDLLRYFQRQQSEETRALKSVCEADIILIFRFESSGGSSLDGMR